MKLRKFWELPPPDQYPNCLIHLATIVTLTTRNKIIPFELWWWMHVLSPITATSIFSTGIMFSKSTPVLRKFCVHPIARLVKVFCHQSSRRKPWVFVLRVSGCLTWKDSTGCSGVLRSRHYARVTSIFSALNTRIQNPLVLNCGPQVWHLLPGISTCSFAVIEFSFSHVVSRQVVVWYDNLARGECGQSIGSVLRESHVPLAFGL